MKSVTYGVHVMVSCEEPWKQMKRAHSSDSDPTTHRVQVSKKICVTNSWGSEEKGTGWLILTG